MKGTARATLLLALLVGPALLGAGAQGPPGAATARVRAAQAVLLTAYPELRTRRVTWRVQPTPTGLVVVLDARAPLGPFEPPPPPSAEPLVRATVELDDAGTVRALRAVGTAVGTARLAALRATLGSPTERVAADALRAASARFVPDPTTDTRGLAPAGVRTVLGAPDLRSPRFALARDETGDSLTWRVELERTVGGVVTRSYTLVVDPFDGRLISLVRR